MDMGAAKVWVEEHYPTVTGSLKAALILAYGAGLDAGLAEAQETLESYREEVTRILAVSREG